jgi:hypothetical protein
LRFIFKVRDRLQIELATIGSENEMGTRDEYPFSGVLILVIGEGNTDLETQI